MNNCFEIEDQASLDFELLGCVVDMGEGTNDHNVLINRDLPEQHPIEAITGLREELDELKPKAYDKMNKISDWLYEGFYTNSDYDYAYNFMETRFREIANNFGCSTVYNNGLFGKNFDWLYNWCVDFVVHSEGSGYKSMGVSGSISTLTKQFMESGQYDDAFKIVPFVLNEGVNENGVFAGINVVPTHETKGGTPFSTPTTGTNPHLTSRPICSVMLVKVVLDRCATATAAVNMIRDEINVYCPHTESLDEEMHLFIGDSNKQYIVEFINNQTEIIDVTGDYPWMTNYYRYGAEFNSNGTLIWQSLTDHATGVTRNDIIAANYDNADDVVGMKNLMNSELKFTEAYEKHWLDEFCGDYPTYGNLTIADVYEHPEKYTELMAKVEEWYNNRDRNDPKTWQTEHSCVYDILNGKLYVVVQEDGVTYEFNFETGGGGGTNDHAQLINRDKPNQHPMSAITGLEDAVKTYTYNQRAVSAVWTITHNLDKYPSVTVVDSGGSTVMGDVQYVNNNSLTITFQGAFSGVAYLN